MAGLPLNHGIFAFLRACVFTWQAIVSFWYIFSKWQQK